MAYVERERYGRVVIRCVEKPSPLGTLNGVVILSGECGSLCEPHSESKDPCNFGIARGSQRVLNGQGLAHDRIRNSLIRRE